MISSITNNMQVQYKVNNNLKHLLDYWQLKKSSIKGYNWATDRLLWRQLLISIKYINFLTNSAERTTFCKLFTSYQLSNWQLMEKIEFQTLAFSASGSTNWTLSTHQSVNVLCLPVGTSNSSSNWKSSSSLSSGAWCWRDTLSCLGPAGFTLLFTCNTQLICRLRVYYP